MKLIIHRGTHEIGGSCVEVSTSTTRIILDLGMPLVAEHDPEKKFDSKILKGKPPGELLQLKILPQVDGLYEGIETSKKIDSLVLSHAHQDHYGLLEYVKKDIPVYLGEETKRLIEVTEMFVTHKQNTITNLKIIETEKPQRIGDIIVTPFLMDHSAFGALGLLIQDKLYSIFYSGDFRGHGRKKAAFDWFLKHGPKNVDCLLMEGTMLGRNDKQCPTEKAVEEKIISLIKETKNIVFGWFSAQNIDRLVSFYRAIIKTNRFFVIDLYTAYLLQYLDGLKSAEYIPKPDWEKIHVFYPHKLMKSLYRYKINEKVIPLFRKKEIALDEISNRRSEIVMMFRDSMWDELKTMGSLEGSTLIYSQFEGYLKEGKLPTLKKEIEEAGIRFETAHTSGHAYIEDLKRYCESLKPKVIVPIHTFHGEKYKEIFKDFNVHRLNDGEEFSIGDALK